MNTIVSLTALDIFLRKMENLSDPDSASDREAARSLHRSGVIRVQSDIHGNLAINPKPEWNEFQALASNREAWETTKKTLGASGEDEHSLLAVLQTLEKNVN